MTSFPTPPSTHRPEISRGRRFRRGYQKVYFILLAVFAVFVLVLYLALNGAGSTDTQPSGSANADQAAPGAPAAPNPVATPAPVQTAPLAPPAGLSRAQALDWRLVQWDKFTDDGYNELVGMPQLNMPTEEWAAIVNQWIYRLPHDTGALSTQFQGHPWAADGVTASSDSVFYPRFANGEMIATKIGEGNSNDPPGTAVRFFYTNIFLPGSSTAELRTLKFVWHESSDHVGHVLVSLCEVKDALRC